MPPPPSAPPEPACSVLTTVGEVPELVRELAGPGVRPLDLTRRSLARVDAASDESLALPEGRVVTWSSEIRGARPLAEVLGALGARDADHALEDGYGVTGLSAKHARWERGERRWSAHVAMIDDAIVEAGARCVEGDRAPLTIEVARAFQLVPEIVPDDVVVLLAGATFERVEVEGGEWSGVVTSGVDHDLFRQQLVDAGYMERPRTGGGYGSGAGGLGDDPMRSLGALMGQLPDLPPALVAGGVEVSLFESGTRFSIAVRSVL